MTSVTFPERNRATIRSVLPRIHSLLGSDTCCSVVEGKARKEAASFLCIGAKTAESHRTRLMEKLDIHKTAGQVRYAIRLGFIHP